MERRERISTQHVGDHRALFDEFLVGGGDFGFGEGVEVEAGDRFVGAGGGGFHREAGPDVGVEPVEAFRFHGDGMDFPGCHQIAHVVDEGVGGGGGGGGSARGDNGGSALADFFAEFAFEPGAVGDDGFGGAALDFGVAEGGEHRGTVVAEDENVRNGRGGDAGFFGEHRLRAVLVEADHGGEAVGRKAAGHAGGDHAIGVRGISDHGDAGVAGGDLVDDPALGGENFSVVCEKVGALHAGSAGLGADEQAPVRVAEGRLGVVGENHFLKQRKRAVVEFHGHAFEGLHGFFDGNLEELENDGLVGTEHRARGDAWEEGVGDLTGGPGDGYANGCFHRVGI